MLERNGFRIIEASDGVEALEIFGRQHGEIDVVVLDFMMPRMSGDETLQRLKEIDPDVRVVLASGYSEHDATGLGLSGVAAFVMKPFTPQALLECVDTALTRR
ncbi:MAG: response regulator [Sandaracinaceae bacterium]|nr:response regulator [Sandaracinaceae bacterium]